MTPLPPRVRTVIRFVITAMALFLLMIAPWPGVREWHGRGYRSAAGTLFYRFGDVGQVDFLEDPLQEGESRFTSSRHVDTIIRHGKSTAPPNLLSHDSWQTAYLPAAKVIALVLATPIGWIRRAWGLFSGLILIHAFIAVRLAVLLTYWSSQPGTTYQLFELGDAASTVTGWMYQLLCDSSAALFLAPVFIWLLVSFRREDFAGWLAVRNGRGHTKSGKESYEAGDATHRKQAARASSAR